GMMPGHRWLSKVADGTKIPHNALIVACTAPALICVLIWFNDGILVAVTSFAILGIYLAFQMVVLGALRQRARGWKPAGPWSLGGWGVVVNIAALAVGFLYLITARPDRKPDAPEDDAIAVAEAIRPHRAEQ